MVLAASSFLTFFIKTVENEVKPKLNQMNQTFRIQLDQKVPFVIVLLYRFNIQDGLCDPVRCQKVFGLQNLLVLFFTIPLSFFRKQMLH